MSNQFENQKKIKLLGEGTFGKAYLVEVESDGTKAVIKQMDIAKMSEEERKDTLMEAKILEKLQHPNIIKFKEVYKTKKNKLCIVMDQADGGDLAQAVAARRKVTFDEDTVLDWFTQICLAIKHIHDRKVIHRDLKSQNIFLTKDGTIKLGDFGIAKMLNFTNQMVKTMVGTPQQLSPEIVEGKKYSFKSDVWSLGILLQELCTLKPPFDANSLQNLALKIVNGKFAPIPSKFSSETRNLVTALLIRDPNKRPRVHDILEMPVLKRRIPKFLSKNMITNEFKHTVIHFKDLEQIFSEETERGNESQRQQKRERESLEAQVAKKIEKKFSDKSKAECITERSENMPVMNSKIMSPNDIDFSKKEIQLQRQNQNNNINNHRQNSSRPMVSKQMSHLTDQPVSTTDPTDTRQPKDVQVKVNINANNIQALHSNRDNQLKSPSEPTINNHQTDITSSKGQNKQNINSNYNHNSYLNSANTNNNPIESDARKYDVNQSDKQSINSNPYQINRNLHVDSTSSQQPLETPSRLFRKNINCLNQDTSEAGRGLHSNNQDLNQAKSHIESIHRKVDQLCLEHRNNSNYTDNPLETLSKIEEDVHKYKSNNQNINSNHNQPSAVSQQCNSNYSAYDLSKSKGKEKVMDDFSTMGDSKQMYCKNSEQSKNSEASRNYLGSIPQSAAEFEIEEEEELEQQMDESQQSENFAGFQDFLEERLGSTLLIKAKKVLKKNLDGELTRTQEIELDSLFTEVDKTNQLPLINILVKMEEMISD